MPFKLDAVRNDFATAAACEGGDAEADGRGGDGDPAHDRGAA